MNVSEFERTKPTETMAAINRLIKDLKEIEDNNSSANPAWVVEKLNTIKSLLKDGK